MTGCVVKGCRNASDKRKENTNITFHIFPNEPTVVAKWIKILRHNRREHCWKPTKNTRICSIHFRDSEKYKTKGGISKLRRNAVPSKNLNMCCLRSPCDSHDSRSDCCELQEPQPGTSDSDTSNAADHSESDPLAQDGCAQCRCCGESTKRFVDTDSAPSYITDNKTSLSINGINVEIDFNDQAPKVCLPCNKKLKEMLDFVKLVKFAQDNLIDLGAENRELLIVKTEYDSNDDDDDSAKDKYDTNEGETDAAEKSGCGEISTHKRKSNDNETTAYKLKKTKVEETEREESDLIIDIKEEVMIEEYTDEPETSINVIVKSELDINVTMETDNGNEENETNKTNLGFREATTEPPDEASELEMATRTLLNELGDDGTAAGERGHYG